MWELINRIVNQLITHDPEASQKLAALDGKNIQIEVSDLPLNILIQIEKDRLTIFSNEQYEHAHTTIRGPMSAYVALLLSKNLQAAIEKGLVIEGDLQAGQLFRNLAMNLEIDWEELLSHYTGDIVANSFGNFIRTAKHKRRQFFDSLSRNISEYLLEERDMLPRKEEVDQFLQAADDLRHQVDRLEARIKYLGITSGNSGTHHP